MFNTFYNFFFFGILKVNDENSRIRIHTKMSWIRNTPTNDIEHPDPQHWQHVSSVYCTRILLAHAPPEGEEVAEAAHAPPVAPLSLG